MRTKLILFLLCSLAMTAHAQETNSKSLDIGDPAPAIKVRKWLKGTPVTAFEKGRVYVVEFWATWCAPCIAGMPHLSGLARSYKDKVTVSGISILERKATTPARVDAFVDSMGNRMDYNVAADDSHYMATNWFRASGEKGIPLSFVVDQMGRIAWIGLPKKLDDVLPKVINGTWRIEEAMANRKREMEVRILDDKVAEALNPYMGHPGKPDSAILVIQKILNEHPELKYAPRLGHFYIYSLVKTDTEKAYRYGKELMAARMPDDPPYQSISDAVYYITEVAKKEVPGKLYELGAEALQAQIDNYPWSMDIPVTYDNIAAWYFRAGRRDKAVEAEEKAIEAIKKNMVTKAALPVLETKLQNYKRI